MSTLFISYRRSDSQPFTNRLYDRIREEFGRDNVFIDIDSMPLGNDFPTVLANVLSQTRIVLVVIGPDWETVTEPDGTRRLYNPQDFVRLEVEAALKRDIAVVPVLVGGAAFPDERKLPVSLRPLCRRHAIMLGNDEEFDSGLDRLIRGLKRLLAEGLAELPPDMAMAAIGGDRSEMIGLDQSFPMLDEQVATGNKLVVLCGPAGIGKSVTAAALAKRHTPKVKCQHIVRIDAREELYELSLMEAVGESYGDEFYRDHDGVRFTSLPFRTQRRLAVDLLAKDEATVILDGAGETSYPRNAALELDLARRIAKELSAKSVLVLVTTRDEAYWADLNPIRLKGLAPLHAQALLLRECRKTAPALQPDDLAKRVGGEAVMAGVIERGSPGELIAAAHRSAGEGAGAARAKSGHSTA